MKDFADIDNSVGSWPSVTAQDCSGAGETDGTAIIAETITDYFGFIQALLTEADITPDDAAETSNASQILDAIKKVTSSWSKNLQIPDSISSYYRYDADTDGDLVVSCGNNGADLTTQYTYDGLNWTNLIAGAAISKYGLGIAYGNSYWVMVVGGGNNVYYSSDPTSSWSFNDITITQLNSVAYGNGYFTAVGPSGALYHATDPSGSWTSNTQGSENLNDVYYDSVDDVWVVVGENGTVYTRDTNPIGAFTLNDQGSQDFNGVTKGGTLWVACGDNNVIYTASDPASTWTSRTSDAKASTDLYDISYGNGVFSLVGEHSGTIDGDGVQVSFNGIDWEVVPCDFDMNCCLYAHNRFYHIGSQSNICNSLRHG